MGCKVFVDESGDTGIKTVRSDGSPGASPYFVLAAAVMPSAVQVHASQVLKNVEFEFGKSWRHATDLNHWQTVYFSRTSSNLNMRLFSVVSKKSTLGQYANDISWKPHRFYNKCCTYLLECVGSYLANKGMFSGDHDVIFEGRNHDFDALRRYFGRIKDNPLHSRAKLLQCFNPFGFVERAKHEEPLLKFADLAAHATYQCVNKSKSNYGIPEARYVEELQAVFGADENGKVLGEGIKCIHNLESVELDPKVLASWRALRGKPRIPIK